MAAPINGVIDVWAQPGFPQLLHMPEMESLRRWTKVTPPPEGIAKVMFATNYPMLFFTPCMSQIEGLGLKPEAQEKFLRLNAMRVFQL